MKISYYEYRGNEKNIYHDFNGIDNIKIKTIMQNNNLYILKRVYENLRNSFMDLFGKNNIKEVDSEDGIGLVLWISNEGIENAKDFVL